MGHPGPRFEHNAGNTADWNLYPDATDINEDERSIQYIEFAVFEKNKR